MSKSLVIMFLITTEATLLNSCSAFLLAYNCPAPSPCTCSGSSSSSSYVYCQGKSLKDIPDIKRSNSHVNTLYLYFYSNSSTIIHDNAFSNFSPINAKSINLELYSNKIHTVEDNAFSGIENVTNILRLQSNNLTILPSAIGKLVNLKYLYIFNNPLHSVDSSVMSNIGRSLTYLFLDMGSFTEWPHEFQFLRVLQTLVARYVPFSHLDINAFDGFESTLTTLRLYDSRFEKVPYAICHLSHLQTFEFEYNTHLKENISSIFEPCIGKLSTVTSLNLGGNDLHVFPDVFTLFPSLTTLSLDNNKLEYIENSKLPSSSALTYIDLRSNLFERIPSALNKLKSLIVLFIGYNNIKAIETADVAELSLLTYLDLSRNPITYMSPSALKHNLNLKTLDLRYTNLDHVPLAVTLLPKLRNLQLN